LIVTVAVALYLVPVLYATATRRGVLRDSLTMREEEMQ
jgi:hypothetical protein